MGLTDKEIDELEDLRYKQQNNRRWLSQEEFDRIKELVLKQFN